MLTLFWYSKKREFLNWIPGNLFSCHIILIMRLRIVRKKLTTVVLSFTCMFLTQLLSVPSVV